MNKYENMCDPEVEKRLIEERCRKIQEENLKKEKAEACHNMLCAYFSKGAVLGKEISLSNCSRRYMYLKDMKKCLGYERWNNLTEGVKKAVLLDIKRMQLEEKN